jgi:hypothetical protein
MVSAIVMAGYNNKRAVKKYSRIVAENYGESFIESGYKVLREFTTVQNGKTETKPLIQYTLENLYKIDVIDEIIIVGHTMLLKQRLGKFINRHKKPCRLVNQNSKIAAEIVERFKIKPRKVKYNSISGNIIKAYAESSACDNNQHALFVAADSPLTSTDFIERFIESVQAYKDQAGLIFPIVYIDGNKDKLGRNPLKMINDTPYLQDQAKDEFGRQGFRLSSLLYANPHLFDINTVNTAYSLRKALSPTVQLQLYRITQSLGYPNVYSKYFFKKNLTVKEMQNICSEFFKGRVKLLPIMGEEATYDYDGTASEYRMISDMLKST